MTFDLRNFSGAALGTLLGILAIGHISWWSGPVAGLIGAILGYHHMFVLAQIASMIENSGTLIRNPSHMARSMLDGIAGLLRGSSLSERATARITITCAIVAFLLANAAHVLLVDIALAWFAPDYHEVSGKWLLFTVLMVALALFFYGLSIRAPVVGGRDEWAYWYMPRWRYFRMIVSDLSVMTVAFMMALPVALLWLATAGAAYLLVIMLPVTITCGVAKGLYFAAQKGRYWPGFVVSCITMFTTAWMFGHAFNDYRILWTVAVVAAFIAGGIVEIWRLTLVWLATYHPRSSARVTIGACLAAPNALFWRMSLALEDALLPDDSRLVRRLTVIGGY